MKHVPFSRRVFLAAAILAFFGGFALIRLTEDEAGAIALLPTPPETPFAVSSFTPPVSPEKTPAPPGSKPAENAGSSAPPAVADAALPVSFQANPPVSAERKFSWEPLMTRLETDGFDKKYLQAAFDGLNSPPLPEFMAQKAIELYGRYGKASLAAAEAEKLKFAPPDYSRIAGGMTVAAGRRVMNNNAKFFENLHSRYGVPAPFVIAVMMVETGIGAETGRQSALLALGSMAVTRELGDVLPVINGLTSHHQELGESIPARSEWAYNEVKALLEYAKLSGKDPAAIPGSVYGAIGICQFMPSNIPKFGASANAKKPVPDLFQFSDAAASVARYLSAHGWKNAKTPKAQISVLRAYNHSDIYAATVYGVATSLMTPSTHRSAQNARLGGNAVKAAREDAKASIPTGTKKAKPMNELPAYSKLLE